MNINHSTHSEILAKKYSRIGKHTGRKLKQKIKAYDKAVKQYGMQEMRTIDSSNRIVSHFAVKIPKPSKRPVTVETGIPKWRVWPPGKDTFTVQASNERDARAQARVTLAIRALPPGTKVEQVL